MMLLSSYGLIPCSVLMCAVLLGHVRGEFVVTGEWTAGEYTYGTKEYSDASGVREFVYIGRPSKKDVICIPVDLNSNMNIDDDIQIGGMTIAELGQLSDTELEEVRGSLLDASSKGAALLAENGGIGNEAPTAVQESVGMASQVLGLFLGFIDLGGGDESDSTCVLDGCPSSLPNLIFGTCCNNHDQCYCDGGCERDRTNCDADLVGCLVQRGALLVLTKLGVDTSTQEQILKALLNLFGKLVFKYLEGSCGGEPHFYTLQGEYFDYHGVCDLNMIHNSAFGDGVGLDLHVRTEEYESLYSIISNAALRIGNDILEVTKDGKHFLNGVSNALLPVKLDGKYTVKKETSSEAEVFLEQVSHGFTKSELENSVLFTIDIGADELIEIQAWKGFLWVNVAFSKKNTQNSVGLMGTWGEPGKKLGRDGVTDFKDPNEFAENWQVLNTEPKLFQDMKTPQYPEKCIRPASAVTARRLGEEKAAEAACANIHGPQKQFCMLDVMVTGDQELAKAYKK